MIAGNARRSFRLLTIVGFSALALVAAACSDGDVAGAAGGGSSVAPTTAEPGELAPTTTFSTYDGTTATLADYSGKPIVLNFWASWCPSCVAEMSSAFKPVEEELGDQINFIGMNIQDDRTLADALMKQTGVNWIAAEDPPGNLYLELGGIAMPFTVYISADGFVVEKHNGPLTEGQLRSQISEAFG